MYKCALTSHAVAMLENISTVDIPIKLQAAEIGQKSHKVRCVLSGVTDIFTDMDSSNLLLGYKWSAANNW